ncbi:hypothetical protein NECAME_07803 [Necator americanus]|uniref:Uncharacterized protein n=1 Tax=Necator americanus TaxID=51031 RepID=W2TM38_NECAM|nr:hypothetical protein NECAME_07803 [Necator americanus]ETN82798.1 hypothetical protein NECAME_07803 [Necator americanus]
MFCSLYTFIAGLQWRLFKGCCESHALLSDVVDVAVLTNERIAENPRRTETSEIEWEYGEQALIGASLKLT